MDAKTSPLAMLAKTCSQIGSDPLPSISKTNGSCSKKGSSPELSSINMKAKEPSSKRTDKSRSRSSSTEIRVTDSLSHRKSPSPSSSSLSSQVGGAAAGSTPVVQPTVRSGLDILASGGGGRSYLHHPVSSTATSHHQPHNPFLASFASSLSESSSASSVCRDPLCRDPLCPTAVRNQQMLAATSSLSSYNSLIAASAASPYYKEAMMAYAAHQRMAAAAAAALAAAPPGSAGGTLPYVCNWVAGNESIFWL